MFVSLITRSPLASLLFKGLSTWHATVKWTILHISCLTWTTLEQINSWKLGGGGGVLLCHNPGHRLSFHSGHRVLLHLNFWALRFGFEKFWLKDSCIPKFTYLKLLFMMLMDNLQFGFRVLVYPKLWCKIDDSIIPKLTVEKEKSLNPLTPKSD